MLWVEVKYANMLSSRLDHFKVRRTNPYVSNFRCMFCGDSKRNKYKARGYLTQKDNSLFYYCHNCSKSLPFSMFLKGIDPVLYSEYRLENFKNNMSRRHVGSNNTVTIKEQEFVVSMDKLNKEFSNHQFYSFLKPVTELPENHPAVCYLKSREIPKEKFDRIYFTPAFLEFARTVYPDHFQNQKQQEHSRIVFPFIDEDGVVFGCSARALDPALTRYYSLVDKSRSKAPKLFGIDKVNLEKDFFVVEGPIDSLFLNNSLAMAGTAVSGIQHFFADKSKAILTFDNEPRNKEVVRTMNDRIKDGFRIVIWPEHIKSKDINEMVINHDLPKENIDDVLKNYTYKGLEAELKLRAWRR